MCLEFGRAVIGYQWPSSSRGIAVWRSLSLTPSSRWVSPTQREQGAEMGHRRCCWLPCLACRIWHCGLMRQHSRSQALETTLSLQGSSLLFCLTLTGRMNTPLLPPALLSYPTPLGTVPAGLGHCDFSLLSYSLSLSLSLLLCMLIQTHTHTHNPSISHAPTKSLAADSDQTLFFPAPPPSPPLKQPLLKFKINWR